MSSRTLLFIKVLVGRELRDRSTIHSQQPYLTLSLDGKEVARSTIIRNGGRNPEFNQLLQIDVGRWWRGKELVIQLFHSKTLLSDAFIGGARCTLAEMIRIVGLDEDAEYGSAEHRTAMIAGSTRFVRPTRNDLRTFGELLPILPNSSQASMMNMNEEGAQSHVREGRSQSFSGASSRSHSPSSAASATSSSSSSSLLSPDSSATLPLTWILLCHGGGAMKPPATLPPDWRKPAGKIALYIEYYSMPLSASGNDTGLPQSWMSMDANQQLAWLAAWRQERRAQKSKRHMYSRSSQSMSSIPSVHARAQPSPAQGNYPVYGQNGQAINGVDGAHPRPNLEQQIASAKYFFSGVFQVSRYLIGHLVGQVKPPVPPAVARPVRPPPSFTFSSAASSSSSSSAPVPVVSAPIVSSWSFFHPSTQQDRIFYLYFIVLAATLMLNYIFFPSSRPSSSVASSSFLAFLHSLSPLLLSILIGKFYSNLVNDRHLSHPWRRLDLVASAFIGCAVAVATASNHDDSVSTILRVTALVLTHAYTRASLYEELVIAGVKHAQNMLFRIQQLRGRTWLEALSATVPLIYDETEKDAPMLVEQEYYAILQASQLQLQQQQQFPQPPSAQQLKRQQMPPLWQGILFWSLQSLYSSFNTLFQYMNGSFHSAQRVMRGTIHLTLRSIFLLLGQFVVGWWRIRSNEESEGADEIQWNRIFLVFLFPLCIYGFLFMFATPTNGVSANSHSVRSQSQSSSLAMKLRGRPWLILFGVNWLFLLYAILRYLPLLFWYAACFIGRLIWQYRWSLIGLPFEYICTLAFLPHTKFREPAIAAMQNGIPQQQQQVLGHRYAAPQAGPAEEMKQQRKNSERVTSFERVSL